MYQLFKKYICGNECEFFLDNFLNSMRDGFMLNKLLRDIDGNPISFEILEINKAFEKLFEVSKESIIGKPITEVFEGMDKEWLEIYSSVESDNTSLQKDVYFKAINKHFRVTLINQTKDKFIILFNDITELVTADEALKKHFMLFEYAKDIIFYLRTDGSVLDANKTAVEHYGYTKSELLNMKIQQIRDSSTLEAFEEQMQISAARGVVFESIHVKKDGTTFPVEVSSRTLDIHGELIRFHIVRDITDRKKAEEKLKYFANYDPLTGIYNRGYLMYQFRKTLEQADIEDFKFAVMLFDIDKFKVINDTYGHHAGDEILRRVANRLQEAVKKSDIIGRLGGDEFLVVQPFIKDTTDPLILAKKILNCISKPIEWEGNTLDVRISIGISIYPESSDNIKGLIHCADNAMYIVKQNGGNSYNY